ncbi:TonB-dependent siderophore receptor (plasmid) [Salipiger sp. H15]|uniref:TonB-dependent siderophore receptor n=1 Tax=Alloyangia sp. H15 TaxID=3029062 RepID=A0AAU8AS28_9RHOB
MTHPLPAPALSRLSLLLTSCATLGLLAALPASAQQSGGTVSLGTIFIDTASDGTDDDETIVADQVTSGSGLPSDVMDSSATISVITSKEIAQRGAQTTEQILQYTSGISTDFYGRDDRYDYFKIRGYDATTYRDGMLIGDAFGGVREEPFAFDRVEVLKGANSTAFGVGDPGGAVNFITKSPTGERLREIYGTLGSFNHKELGFDLGDTFAGSGDLSWRLTGKMQDAEAETDGSNDDETFLMGGLAWRPTDRTTVSLVYDYLYRDGYPNSSGYPATGDDFDRDLFLGEPDFNYLDTDRHTLTFKLEHDFGGGLELGTTARYTKGTGGFGYVFLDAVTSEADTTVSRYYFANDADFENFVADAHLLYETSFGTLSSRTMGGIEYRDNHRENTLWYTRAADIDWTDPVYTGGLDLDATDPYQDTTTDTEVASLYLQQEFAWDRLIVQGGLRRDWIDNSITDNLTDVTTESDDVEDTLRLGLTYKLSPNLSLFGSYAESVVPANLGDEPERGRQYEIGVKYRPDGFRGLFSASIYDLTKYNETVTNADTLLEEVRGESRVRGIDLEAKAELTEQLAFTAAYTYLETEILESDNGANNGNRLASTPEHSGSVWADYSVPGQGSFGDLNLGLGVRYTGEYWRSDANTSKTDAAWIWDAAVGYEIAENTRMRLAVTNLLDEKHIAQGGFSTDYYNAGREISVTLNHSW